MSNFKSVAMVTATLQREMQAAVQADVVGATVTTVRPIDSAGANLPTLGVNLFLFQISPNPHHRNADLPTRRASGEAMQRPVAAVDLHYLVSFYGDDTKLEQQRLLGSAIAFLHSQPQLTRAQIQAAAADASKTFLADSDLADQADLVRFAPMSLSLEELSRLWSILLQTTYVLSFTFKASVVLLERPIATTPTLPVRDLRLVATPLRRPFISSIVPVAGAAILPGAAIAVEGGDLMGGSTFVAIDDAPVTPSAIEPTKVTLALPAGLAAGPHGLLVRQGLDPLAPGGGRPVFDSNLAAFVLQPLITQTAGKYDISIDNVQGAGAAPRSATLTLHVAPGVGARQTATLELLTAQQTAYTFLAAPRAEGATQLVFAATGVLAGDYLFQLRIDGAASPLDLDANGAAIGPKETIP
jgi:hypothetical protein